MIRIHLLAALTLALLGCGSEDGLAPPVSPASSSDVVDRAHAFGEHPDMLSADVAQRPESPEDEGACGEIGPGPFASCCELGAASCLQTTSIPEGLRSQLTPCGEAGSCVPDGVLDVLMAGERYEPKACISVGSAPGVCLSVCLARVGQFRALLPQADCAPDERCAPCVDPLTGEDSGACDGGLSCGEAVDEPEPKPEPVAAYSCDEPPVEPLVDPSVFPECCPGARCLPMGLVPSDSADLLASCDDGVGRCVPDPLIESGGFYTAPTCTSLGGAEGRCLSTCLPDVGAQVDILPQSTCSPNELCSPCCNPFTGESTGACEQACDPGPAAACMAPVIAECCDGAGQCVQPDLIPEDKLSNLKDCKGDDKGLVCLPDVMQDPAFEGDACHGNSIVLGEYDGVCLPSCLGIPLKITFDFLACPPKWTCVPCTDPFGGSTGAPGCPL